MARPVPFGDGGLDPERALKVKTSTLFCAWKPGGRKGFNLLPWAEEAHAEDPEADGESVFTAGINTWLLTVG